jgi:hypothetical protein
MSSLRRSDTEDRIVVEVVVEPTSGRILRGDELGYVRARGTRQNLPLRPPAVVASGTGTIAAQAPPADEPAAAPVRDPVAVLRAYPVSTLDRQSEAAQSRQTLRAPSPGPHLDDKMRLAHLALDLYRELEGGHACGTREPQSRAQTCAVRRAPTRCAVRWSRHACSCSELR